MKIKSFAELLKEAKQRDAFWMADAIHTFTEELHEMAASANLSRAELARRMGVSPAYITKLFRGDVNFTIQTMVRLARVVGGKLHLHLTPQEQEDCWLPSHTPVCKRSSFGVKADNYKALSDDEVTEDIYELLAPAA